MTKKSGISVRETIVFAMLGAIMYCSKMLMEFAPNIHFLGMFTMVFTIVYRKKALIPIYVCVFLVGMTYGFALWWVPYLYLWTILWGVTMLLPQNLPKKVAVPLYMVVCALHGLTYGTLYAPFQALAFGMNFRQTIAWIVAGLPWDLVHAEGNLAAGTLIVPLSSVMIRIEKKIGSRP